MVVLATRRRQSWIWDLSQQREPLQQQVEESEENVLLIIYQEVEPSGGGVSGGGTSGGGTSGGGVSGGALLTLNDMYRMQGQPPPGRRKKVAPTASPHKDQPTPQSATGPI